MSYNETHMGKLRVFTKVKGETEVDTLKRVLKKFDKEFNQEDFEYWDSNISAYIGNTDLYDDIFFVNGKFYINEDHIESDDSYLNHLVKNDDGTYSYAMVFYNGGTCFSEMIEKGLQKLDKI